MSLTVKLLANCQILFFYVTFVSLVSLYTSTVRTRSIERSILGTEKKSFHRQQQQRQQQQLAANYSTPFSSVTWQLPRYDSQPSRPLPAPLQILEQYIQQHSVDALRNESHLEHRKYAIALYQCPKAAGNNLHRFWNNVLWAILTNRTVLYKYWNRDMCERYGLHRCHDTNTENDCSNVLIRAPWIASYDEWIEKIRVTSGKESVEPFLVPYHATVGEGNELKRYQGPSNYDQDYGVDLVSKYPYKIIMLPLCYYKFRHFSNVTLQETLLKSDWARGRAKHLFSLGAEFLYGMLHRYTFTFAESVKSSVPASFQDQNTDLYTIALHSRHRYEALDGCDIRNEIDCLERVIGQRSNQAAHVQVRVMADRACTISSLTEWLRGRNHSVVAAVHDETSYDTLREHGPFAGVGFFRDLALVSAARSAFIGRRRSSSDCLREMMVFDRAMAIWQNGARLKKDARRVIDTCLTEPEPEYLPAKFYQ